MVHRSFSRLSSSPHHPSRARALSHLRAGLARQLDWLNEFEAIVLLFDQDEAGEKAAQECASLFPTKAQIASLPLQDANEMLCAGRVGELVEAIWSAPPVENSKPRSPSTTSLTSVSL